MNGILIEYACSYPADRDIGLVVEEALFWQKQK